MRGALHQITEQAKALSVQVARQAGDPGYVAPWVIEAGDIAGQPPSSVEPLTR